MKNNEKGFAIALAWPEMYCKQTAAWYDSLTHLLGISKNHYYKVGHAALVLVDSKGNCHYFDFGRYHAPYQWGRVRSAEADHDLIIKTKAVFSDDGTQILNFREILEELQNNPACHGEGKLHASFCSIDYSAAAAKAREMHERHIWPYGPFIWNGTNCSRFVNTVIRAGKPDLKKWLYLRFLKPITPTTLNNVHALNKKEVLPHMLAKAPFYPAQKPPRERLYGIIPMPEKPAHLQDSILLWLSGEGAGSWFQPEFKENTVLLKRFTATGELEGETELKLLEGEMPKSDQEIKITYPSALHLLNLEVNGKKIKYGK